MKAEDILLSSQVAAFSDTGLGPLWNPSQPDEMFSDLCVGAKKNSIGLVNPMEQKENWQTTINAKESDWQCAVRKHSTHHKTSALASPL